MQITDEQDDIISAFSRGESLVADARAGAGKTSTTRMCAESRPERRGVFLAFNRAIAGDAKTSFPPSCYCSTVHSMAFRAIGHEYQHRLNGPRVTGRQTAEILGWSRWMRFGIASWSPSKVVRVAMDTVTRFCHSADLEIGKQHVPWIDGIEDGSGDLGQREEFVACIVPLARKAWIDLQDFNGRLRFSHDAYLKLYSLSDPKIPCDYLCFDEAQDSSPVIAHIIQCQDHAQKMITGDPLQQIYEWRGSVDAMSAFDVELRLPLSQSFRFGEPIANEANHWLELLDADPLIRGSDWIESAVGPVEAPKAILCRTNAQVVSEVIEQQKKGFQPAIVGGAAPIISFAEAAIELKAGKGTWHHDLQGFKDWEQVKSYVEQDHGGRDLRTLVRVVDEYGPPMVIAMMNNCQPETVAPVTISTAHKAKGREWASVRLANDFHVQPHEDKKTGEMKDPPESELRLAYVAVTRAKHELDVCGLYASEAV